MKKLLSILILLFLFISCEEPPKREIVGEYGTEVVIISNNISPEGVEHDPDCKTCKKDH